MSDQISTLKENAILNLRKELKSNHLKFKIQKFATIFSERMSDVYRSIYALARRYNLDASTYCLFDKVFRTYVAKNLREFLECKQNWRPSDPLQNVGSKIPTDLKTSNQKFTKNITETVSKDTKDTFDLKMKLLDVSSFICLRVVMKH